MVTLKHVRRLTQLALGLQMLLVVSGTSVRVTNSGLGCPTWPRCTGGSLTNTPALGYHGYIEFGNRTLAVVMEAVGILLLLAVRRVPHPRSWSRLALVQAAIVPIQAVIGGILVLSGLNPYVLILHFLTSFPLVFAAAALLRLQSPAMTGSFHGPEGPERTREASVHAIRVLSAGILGAVAVVLVLGTLVTGTGPHAGDPKVHRLPFNPRDITQLHADGVFLLTGLVIALVALAWQTTYRRWALTLLGLIVAQAGVGYWQYFTSVPPALVALHVALATTTFTVAAWLLLLTRSPDVPEPVRPVGVPSRVATAPA